MQIRPCGYLGAGSPPQPGHNFTPGPVVEGKGGGLHTWPEVARPPHSSHWPKALGLLLVFGLLASSFQLLEKRVHAVVARRLPLQTLNFKHLCQTSSAGVKGE